MGGFDWARERPSGALCAVRRTPAGIIPRPLRCGRHPARRVCHVEMASGRPTMQLHAMDAGRRTFDARRCHIWACQLKGADGDGGLHDLFARDDLGGKNRRWAHEHSKPYPAPGEADLS